MQSQSQQIPSVNISEAAPAVGVGPVHMQMDDRQLAKQIHLMHIHHIQGRFGLRAALRTYNGYYFSRVIVHAVLGYAVL